MNRKPIRKALLSVYHKDGLEPIARRLHQLGVELISTGGTKSYLEALNLPVTAVEDLTSYPSILGGRVKTLHPKIFGGILAQRQTDHLNQLRQYEIPEIDLVVVDLYPFEQTVAEGAGETDVIEKIDIGGIALIRAAAKNFNDVVIVPSREDYPFLLQMLQREQAFSEAEERRQLARRAFEVSSHYDMTIFSYFEQNEKPSAFKTDARPALPLRYGENPHQQAHFFGPLNERFRQLGGKDLSYNNLVDIDAGLELINEFWNENPTFAILKHTNPCGLAQRSTALEAWQAALAGDPLSAFGGVIIANCTIDEATATAINEIFYEVLVAPAFAERAKEILLKKKKRIILQLQKIELPAKRFKSLLGGVIQQEADAQTETLQNLQVVTEKKPNNELLQELLFANRIVKHLKSNAIALTKNHQLIGMGCGQTSRIDALNQAIEKAGRMGFRLRGAVLASDAFFPFADSVQAAHKAGIQAIIQPGGSIRDHESIAYCNQHNLPMVFTGVRHFKH